MKHYTTMESVISNPQMYANFFTVLLSRSYYARIDKGKVLIVPKNDDPISITFEFFGRAGHSWVVSVNGKLVGYICQKRPWDSLANDPKLADLLKGESRCIQLWKINENKPTFFSRLFQFLSAKSNEQTRSGTLVSF